MDNINEIEDIIHKMHGFEIKSSAVVTYDRFPYDPDYQTMYTDLAKGVHRPFDPNRPGDWGTKLIIECFRHHLRGRDRVLDIGTGVGWPAYWLEDCVGSLTAVDQSEHMIRLAEEARRRWHQSRIRFRRCSGLSLPMDDSTFDAVVMDAVLEFTEDAVGVLREVARVLKPEGIVVSKTTNWRVAFRRSFGGFENGKRVLYPDAEAKAVGINGKKFLKYRRCLSEPPEERTYFVEFEEDTGVDELVRYLNGGEIQAGCKVLKHLKSRVAEGAICRQFIPETIRRVFEEAGFEVRRIHGCREVGTGWGRVVMRWCFLRPIRFCFDWLTTALVPLALSTPSDRGLDMIVVAKVRK